MTACAEKVFDLEDAILALREHYDYLAARKYLTEQDKRLLAVYQPILKCLHGAYSSRYWGGGSGAVG